LVRNINHQIEGVYAFNLCFSSLDPPIPRG
jgi:hypothetical protein